MTATNMFAPRLMSEKKRKMPEEEIERVTHELKAIKKKNAARMIELTKKAYGALVEMEEIEGQMDTEAKKVYQDYITELSDFKLTFAKMYKEDMEYSEEHHSDLETCRKYLQQVKEEAEEMTSGKEECA